MPDRCEPIHHSFHSRDAAEDWLKRTHCQPPCVDAGGMLMGVTYVEYTGKLDEDGSVNREWTVWHATRFCKEAGG